MTEVSPASFEIRAAKESDLDAIWEIERAVFGDGAWNRDSLEAELRGEYRHYIVLCGGSAGVVGYAGLLAVGGDGDIQTIALAPEIRGLGWGRKMMQELLEEALRRGTKQVFLEVRAGNEPARNLYLSMGFEEIGVRPRYYQPENEDALVLRKTMQIAPRSLAIGTELLE